MSSLHLTSGHPPTNLSNTAAGTSTPPFLSILLRCHNHPYPLFSSPTTDHFTPFHLHLDPPSAQIGFVPRHVVEAIVKAQDSGTFVFSDGRIGLSRRLDTFRDRTQALHTLMRSWREAGLFKDALDGWRNEMYAVYSSDQFPYRSWDKVPDQQGGAVFELERAACALFGLVTYGVHLTAYTHAGPSSSPVPSMGQASSSALTSSTLKIWVPRRSATKATWPNYLDNSVAGGITSGDSPFESIVRECEEEASLAEYVVRERIQQAGVVTYVYRTRPLDQGAGYLQPEVQYVYDLPLPFTSGQGDDQKYIPTPNDGEAQSFDLLSVAEIMTLLNKGEFKPNCALVMVDFLVRKGLIRHGDEGAEGFVELVQLLHRDLGLPMP